MNTGSVGTLKWLAKRVGHLLVVEWILPCGMPVQTGAVTRSQPRSAGGEELESSSSGSDGALVHRGRQFLDLPVPERLHPQGVSGLEAR